MKARIDLAPAVLFCAGVLAAFFPNVALAATPAPTPVRINDIRTGSTPNMMGDPIGALVVVLALGAGTAGATLVVLKLRMSLGRRED